MIIVDIDSKEILKDLRKKRKKIERKFKQFPNQMLKPVIRGLARATPVAQSGRGQVGFAQSNYLIQKGKENVGLVRTVGSNQRANIEIITRRAETKLRQNQALDWEYAVVNNSPIIYYLNKGASRRVKVGFLDKHYSAAQRRISKLIDKWVI